MGILKQLFTQLFSFTVAVPAMPDQMWFGDNLLAADSKRFWNDRTYREAKYMARCSWEKSAANDAAKALMATL